MKPTWVRILGPACVLRLRPESDAKALGPLERGDVVWIDRQRKEPDGTWTLVRLEDGRPAWVPPGIGFIELATRHVAGPPLDLRVEPRRDAEIVRTLREGAIVRVVGCASSEGAMWVRITPASGAGGWVPGGTPLTLYGGTLAEAISGYFILCLGLCFVVVLRDGGLVSNFPFALIGIGLSFVVRAWRVSAQAVAGTARMNARRPDSDPMGREAEGNIGGDSEEPVLGLVAAEPPKRALPSPSSTVPSSNTEARRSGARPGRSPGRSVVARAWRPLSRELLLYVTLATFLLGAYLLLVGISGYGVERDMERPPDRITCAQLRDHGPGSSHHVVITDFYLCDVVVWLSSASGTPTQRLFAHTAYEVVAIVPRDSPYARSARALRAEEPDAVMPPLTEVPVFVRTTMLSVGMDHETAVASLADSMAGRPPSDPRADLERPIAGRLYAGLSVLPDFISNRIREKFPIVHGADIWLLDNTHVSKDSSWYLFVIGLGAACTGVSALIARRLRRLRAGMGPSRLAAYHVAARQGPREQGSR